MTPEQKLGAIIRERFIEAGILRPGDVDEYEARQHRAWLDSLAWPTLPLRVRR